MISGLKRGLVSFLPHKCEGKGGGRRKYGEMGINAELIAINAEEMTINAD